jgi:hypothetical protein
MLNYGEIYLSPPEHWLKCQTPLLARALLDNYTIMTSQFFSDSLPVSNRPGSLLFSKGKVIRGNPYLVYGCANVVVTHYKWIKSMKYEPQQNLINSKYFPELCGGKRYPNI